jgi:multiple sugar transport system substrate-binding protein
VTLTEWDFGAPGIDTLVKQWNSTHPNVHINHVLLPFGSWTTQAQAAIAAKKGPDIIYMYAGNIVFSYSRGLQNLAACVTPAQRQELAQWNLVSTHLSDSGDPYAVPWGQGGVVFYYNKALFAKAGLDPNAPPQTWAQFMSDCAALKSHGIVPIAAGWKDGYYGEWWASAIAGQFMSAAQQTDFIRNPTWTIKPLTTAFDYMLQLSKAGYMTPHAEGIGLLPQAQNLFAAGKAAIFLGATGSGFTFPGLKSHLGVFLSPPMPGSLLSQPALSSNGGFSWTITKWSPHAAAAYSFISFVAQASSQNTANEEGALVPNNVNSNPQQPTPALRQILDWTKHAPKFWGIVDQAPTPQVEAAYDKVVPEIMSGQVSPAAAMQQVEQAQQQSPPVPGLS